MPDIFDKLTPQDLANANPAAAGPATPRIEYTPELKRKYDMERGLAADWRKANDSYSEMRRQLGLMETGLRRFKQGDKNGGSQAVLVTFQKILDPTSVVRESEYARSAQGISALGRLEGYVGRLALGGAGVPASDLESMVQTARDFLNGYKTYNDGVRSRIQRHALGYGLDPAFIFNDFGVDPNTGGVPQLPAPPGGAAPAPTKPDVRSKIAARRLNPPPAAKGDPNAKTGWVESLFGVDNGERVPFTESVKSTLGGVADVLNPMPLVRRIADVGSLQTTKEIYQGDLDERATALERVRDRTAAAHQAPPRSLTDVGAWHDAGEVVRDAFVGAVPIVGPLLGGAGREMESTDPKTRAHGLGTAAGIIAAPKAAEKTIGAVRRLPETVQSARTAVGVTAPDRLMNAMLAQGDRALIEEALMAGKNPGLTALDRAGSAKNARDLAGNLKRELDTVHEATQARLLEDPQISAMRVDPREVQAAIEGPIREAMEIAAKDAKSTQGLQNLLRTHTQDIASKTGGDFSLQQLNQYKSRLYDELRDYKPELGAADQTLQAIKQRQAHNLMQLVNRYSELPDGVSPVKELNLAYSDLRTAYDAARSLDVKGRTKPFLPSNVLMGGGALTGGVLGGVEGALAGAATGALVSGVRGAFNSPGFVTRLANILRTVAPADQVPAGIRIPRFGPEPGTNPPTGTGGGGGNGGPTGGPPRLPGRDVPRLPPMATNQRAPTQPVIEAEILREPSALPSAPDVRALPAPPPRLALPPAPADVLPGGGVRLRGPINQGQPGGLEPPRQQTIVPRRLTPYQQVEQDFSKRNALVASEADKVVEGRNANDVLKDIAAGRVQPKPRTVEPSRQRGMKVYRKHISKLDESDVPIGDRYKIDEMFDSTSAPKRAAQGREIYDAFDETRRELRQKHGDTVRLYRYDVPDEHKIPGKTVTHWMDDLDELNRQIGAEDSSVTGGKRPLVTRDVPIDDIIAVPEGMAGREYLVLNRESKVAAIPKGSTPVAPASPATSVPATTTTNANTMRLDTRQSAEAALGGRPPAVKQLPKPAETTTAAPDYSKMPEADLRTELRKAKQARDTARRIGAGSNMFRKAEERVREIERALANAKPTRISANRGNRRIEGTLVRSFNTSRGRAMIVRADDASERLVFENEVVT